MGLRARQSEFALAAAELILHINSIQYFSCTLGDTYRDPRVFGPFGEKKGYGRANSCHKLRMAIDLNLFINGEYITDHRGHDQIGPWWEQTYKSFDARWGGHFNDPNHYSFAVWGSA